MVESGKRFMHGVGGAVFTVILLKLLSVYQHVVIYDQSKPVELPWLENTILVTLAGLLSVLPRRLQPWACGALLTFHQGLALIDAVYFRFFNDLPSLHLLPMWFQAGRSSESLWSVSRSEDLAIFLPVLVIALFYLRLHRLGWKSQPQHEVGVALLILGVVSMATVYLTMHPVRHTQLQRRFQNIAIAKLFGPVFYHYYDACEWSSVKLGLGKMGEFDPNIIEQVIGESRALSTEDTPFAGRYAGRDLIFIQFESLQYFALEVEVDGRSVMPFLRQAKDRVSTFCLFDQTHLGRSSDAQFIFLNSLQPLANRPLVFSYPTNTFHGLPWLFRERGYRTFYLHPSDTSFWNAAILAKAYGFEERYYRGDLPALKKGRENRGWGLIDSALFRHALEKARTSAEPYFMYLVTVMCHHPYSEDSNPSVDFPPANEASMVTSYLRCVAGRDASLRDLMEELATTERGRQTVICLIGDHEAGLDKSEMEAQGYPTFPESETVPMMIGSVEEFLGLGEQAPPASPRSFGGQMDVAPTVGHVFSLNMEESVFVGWNLFSTQNRGPHYSRVGTWMDQAGRIQVLENPEELQDDRLFRASEMLLQSDGVGSFRNRSSSKM